MHFIENLSAKSGHEITEEISMLSIDIENQLTDIR